MAAQQGVDGGLSTRGACSKGLPAASRLTWPGRYSPPSAIGHLSTIIDLLLSSHNGRLSGANQQDAKSALRQLLNELRLLPYLARHHEPFVDEFIILDDGSRDGSVEFLNAQTKVRIVKANRKHWPYVEQSTRFFNEAGQESRSKAGWIVTCNVNEHVCHKGIGAYLQFCLQDNVTVLSAQCHEVASLEFPSSQGRLCDEVRLEAQTQGLRGPSSLLNRIMVFNPQAIQEAQFDMGSHTANPIGKVEYRYSVELKLLHYKLPGIDYVIQRYR